MDKKPATDKKTPEQLVKAHAKELFDQSITDLRVALLTKSLDHTVPEDSLPKPMSEEAYGKFIQTTAARSIKSAAVFRSTWLRLKGSIFPKDQ